ncbi:MAG TPA: methionine--tRNA ligase subunit beta, partial [Bacteroidetes bacterium]|nr:methionine--tRNA ligase subunit beta [Bacteroidota bacterium]
IGYISATKELTDDWEKYWKDEGTKMVHFIGKDNIVFHCIIFPSMLKAEGSFILPENVPANEFLNLENDKISTSRNWAVWLHEYLEDFPGKQDSLRYSLCASAPETKDNDFTWKEFQARNNNELVAILGNFVNRALVLTNNYYGGKVPPRGALTATDEDILNQLTVIRETVEENLEGYRFREALKEAMNLARLGNKYLAEEEPWKVIKTDPERVKTVMNIALQITANLTIILEPFLPFSMDKLRGWLGMEKGRWQDAGNRELLSAGDRVKNPELLFEKIEDAAIEAQINKLLATKKTNEAVASKVVPAKEQITFDDFSKLDIRTATVLEAERVPKTDKLLKLKIDTGLDIRVIVSGIAMNYEPEQMVGKQISIIANLEPRKIKGIESKGMILMAEESDGKLTVVAPERRVSNGSTVK